MTVSAARWIARTSEISGESTRATLAQTVFFSFSITL
jgi:hypothetical protein